MAGTEISFSGIDIWRVEDGQIIEYWISSDGLHMVAQLNPEGQVSGPCSLKIIMNVAGLTMRKALS
jgi:hypothetical protein